MNRQRSPSSNAMSNLETDFLEVLTREAVRFCSRAVRPFSDPARANAYGPHTGLSSMVLQRKRFQGRTGHMITRVIQWMFVCFLQSLMYGSMMEMNFYAVIISGYQHISGYQ